MMMSKTFWRSFKASEIKFQGSHYIHYGRINKIGIKHNFLNYLLLKAVDDMKENSKQWLSELIILGFFYNGQNNFTWEDDVLKMND